MSGPKAPNIPTPEETARSDRPATSDRPGRGMLFAVFGSLLLTMNDSVAKFLSQEWPVGQIMGLRGTVILFVILGILSYQKRLHALRIQNRKVMALRAGSITAATFVFLTALSLMPIADALAIVFVSPIFATLLAVAVLGEKVGWRRWIAMGVGFFGVFIALNPGGLLSGEPAPYSWQAAMLPLITALLVAVRDVTSRRLVSGDDSLAIMFYTVVCVALAGYVTSLGGEWQTPGWFDIALVLGSAAFMFGAYFFQIESFRFAPVNLVAPFRYVSLLYAALIGYLIWGDVPSWNMALGGAVIVGSGLFIWWRERSKG